MLVKIYNKDLDILRHTTPVIISELDMLKLKRFCIMYGLDVEIKQTKESYYSAQGKLMEAILKKLEYLRHRKS